MGISENSALAAESGSTDGYRKAMNTMMQNMKIAYTGDADVDFVKSMIPHHQGAIDMASVELEFGKDADVVKLAGEIAKAQETEIVIMNEWLANNAALVGTPNPASTTAYEAAMSTVMANMMAPYSGEADADFMKGMIPHHQGAIDMAKVVLQHGKDREIRALAESIVAAQEREIAVMKGWLSKNGQ
ncbi:MAG TPA: DUF305 domain-containing protein [Aestuariivirga sp.]|nr:DUF305 domain-containing protein [Aestuariivirga sp.]